MPVLQIFNIIMVAMIASFLISALIVCSRKWHGKYSLDHELDGIQKFHIAPVPRVGGVAVILGIFCALLFFAIFYPKQISVSHVSSIMALLIASLPAFIAGLIEDVTKRTSVKARLMATIFSALIASVLLNANVHHIDIWGVDSLLAFVPIAVATTAFFVAGGANAINIIDGFNGLAGIVIVIMSAALGFLAWRVADTLVLTMAMLIIGAAIGFLLLNYPFGKLFLGDGGAYFLGFWVAEIAVLLLARNPSVNAWQVLSICAYPVIEVLYSIYRKKFIRSVSPGQPDGLHLHMLVYRRLVSKLIPYSVTHLWIRNAAVVCIIAPPVVVMAFFSVIVGDVTIAGLGLVILQVILYVVVYRRLVRGSWRRTRNAECSSNRSDYENVEITE